MVSHDAETNFDMHQETDMARSHYDILGVPPDASTEEIKSAYRRLAKEYHPDHQPGHSRTFQEIHEAYCVLGDSEKRRHYERERSPRPVRVRIHRSPYSRAEPLVPEEEPVPMHQWRRSAPSGDIFDWILRHFF